tara:strand:- start:54 stop:1049 length:996 start_codon:yes stop_codon:yes gene_type:complete
VKIFVSIASFQDPILKYTIESAYTNAKNKKDLVLGVFDQSKEKLTFDHDVRYITCDPADAKGCCWARSKIQKELFDGEDIFMQVDSHTMFEKDWDKDLLEKYEVCLDYVKRPIITGYPRGFDVITPQGDFLNTKQEYIFRKCQPDEDQTHVMQLHLPWATGYHCGQMAHVIPGKKYFRGFGLAAGLIFTEGSFVEEIPYDPEIYFAGEESTLALRAFTHGWDLIHVPNTPVYHWYNTDEAELKRDLHWNYHESATDEMKKAKDKRTKIAEQKVNNILQGKVKGKYGVGDKRTLKEFANLSGVDYVNKSYQIDKATWYEYEKGGLELGKKFE